MELPSRSAGVALWYANQRKRDCPLVHSTFSYGGQGKSWKSGDAVAAWATEQRDHDYDDIKRYIS
ncbi:Pathogenesis-related protein [Musa troglodytarum]|uniref:Pathogenesis-related protein n=1 Tax=Musa troglodytarum TaxID=320322 RepID=A0A9E7L221_9LILI|nr:Pathogenesis-related protein [Musa troglodytarum]